jgi:hypothetical protein
MNLVTTTSIRRTLRYVEWTVLIVYLLLLLLNRRPGRYELEALPTYVNLVVLWFLLF